MADYGGPASRPSMMGLTMGKSKSEKSARVFVEEPTNGAKSMPMGKSLSSRGFSKRTMTVNLDQHADDDEVAPMVKTFSTRSAALRSKTMKCLADCLEPEAERDSTSTRSSVCETAECDPVRWDNDVDSLREFLQAGGIDTSLYGQGSAKTVERLLKEIQEGSTFLEVQASGEVLRVVEPVFVRLMWGDKVLVQLQQKFPDGRTRQRNMLLAEKMEPGDCGGLKTAALRGLNEELGVPVENLSDTVVRYREDLYSFEVEYLDSPSYPGLSSMYRTHYVQLDILEAGLRVFQHCGLPACEEFSTTEPWGDGVMSHTWAWWPVSKAIAEKVKKMPPRADTDDAAAEKPQQPKTEEELKALLDADGVNTSLFGQGKAKALGSLLKELKEGSSQLIRNKHTQKVQRVVEPAFIHLRWGSKVVVEASQVLECGKERKRNMLLAEKADPTDRHPGETAIRGIHEELGAPLESLVLDEVVRYREDLYCCKLENLDSASYPGLPCCYKTHYCHVDILEAGLPVFKEYGLPGCDDFVTTETSSKGTKTMYWVWWEMEYARAQKVKGFLVPEDREEGASKPKVEVKILNIPDDQAAMLEMLRVGQVPVENWGDVADKIAGSLLSEIKQGSSFLERCSDGKIHRVVQPAFVQMKWKGKVLVPEAHNEDSSSDALQKKDMFQAELGTLKQLQDSTAATNSASKIPINFREDLNCFELSYVDSSSYPGLTCVQRTKYVQFEQRSQAACEY